MALYYTEVKADSPFLYYRLGDASGNLVDNSGSSRTATMTGSPTYGVTGAITGEDNKAITFSGTGQYATWTTDSAYTGDWTVEFWGKFTSFAGYPGVTGAWVANTSGNYGLGLDINTAGDMDINIPLADFTGWRINQSIDTSFATGTWYHVVVTHNASTRIVKIFKNATQVGADVSYATSAGLWNNAKGFRVASSGGANTGLVNGTLDELAVYKSVLSPTRITDHYNAGLANGIAAGTITDTDILGLAPVIAVPTISVTTTDTDVAGQPATVSVTSNVTVNAVVTDTDVTGIAPSQIGAGIQVSAEVTNVGLLGLDNEPLITNTITINADVSNISIDQTHTLSFYIGNVVLSAPTHWYQLNESSGFTFNDSIGTAHGTMSTPGGFPVYDDTGIPGSEDDSIGFTGGQSITLPAGVFPKYSTSPGASAMSVSLWYKGTTNGMLFSWGNIAGDTNTAGISDYEGYLSAQTGGSVTPSVVYDAIIGDGNWHHIALTRTISGGGVVTNTFNTYVDGVQLNTGPSLTATDTRLGFIGSGKSGTNYSHRATGRIDEVLIHNRALTAGEIQTLFVTGLGSEDSVNDDITSANIGVSGHAPTLNAEVAAEVTDIQVKSFFPIIQTPGSVSIGSALPNIGITGKDASIVVERQVTQVALTTNVSIDRTETNLNTGSDVFRYIPIDDNSLTATDADELISINLGAMLYGQQKYQAFKMGNIGSNPITLTITAESLNTEIAQLVSLSTDKITYSSTIVIRSLQSNAVSDPIWIKVNAGEAAPGEATFLLNVEQSNA